MFDFSLENPAPFLIGAAFFLIGVTLALAGRNLRGKSHGKDELWPPVIPLDKNDPRLYFWSGVLIALLGLGFLIMRKF